MLNCFHVWTSEHSCLFNLFHENRCCWRCFISHFPVGQFIFTPAFLLLYNGWEIISQEIMKYFSIFFWTYTPNIFPPHLIAEKAFHKLFLLFLTHAFTLNTSPSHYKSVKIFYQMFLTNILDFYFKYLSYSYIRLIFHQWDVLLQPLHILFLKSFQWKTLMFHWIENVSIWFCM